MSRCVVIEDGVFATGGHRRQGSGDLGGVARHRRQGSEDSGNMRMHRAGSGTLGVSATSGISGIKLCRASPKLEFGSRMVTQMVR
jgi:hypothetical protein